MCPEQGCGHCEICRRLERNTHPDFQLLEPEGNNGYVVAQIRELNASAQRAPLEAEHKVFVLTGADTLAAAPANAFLKTLEEPSATTVFILLAHSADAVLPTIRSRCQVLRFNPLQHAQALALLQEKTGVHESQARIALAACGDSVHAARDFLASPVQQEARALALRTFTDLLRADDLDVLDLAAGLLRKVLEPVAELREKQEAELKERSELLDPVALKSLERYNKRRASAFEKRSLTVLLNVYTGLLRDSLCLAGAPGDSQLINIDAAELLRASGMLLTPAAAARGQEALRRARRRLAQNVSLRLLLEALLFDIREVVLCPR
jgi:DNA polymerase-3 subunit delta'